MGCGNESSAFGCACREYLEVEELKLCTAYNSQRRAILIDSQCIYHPKKGTKVINVLIHLV